MTSILSFLGAAGTVTDSRFLLEVKDHRYLIDCGLFQGGRSEKALNWEEFSIPPEGIDAVLLTHAHIDHVSYLPRFVRRGFHDPLYDTEARAPIYEQAKPRFDYIQVSHTAH